MSPEFKDSTVHTFEHWRDSLEAFLGEPYRWDLPDEQVMYTDENKGVFVCRNNVLQDIISVMEMSILQTDSRVSAEDAQEVKSRMKEIVRIARERGIKKKTQEDMDGIRSSLENVIEILRKY